MKLTSLELLGFKSFLNRTTFRFNEGVTCIVGPNGCGKSNIVDAISWVLGERGTKSLRVKEMGDVIFHGSTVKKPVNMAEVTMGLMNGEKEYAIKRRIYRDGTNEYFINGDIVRLKDIQDFLLGTGIGLHSYAIIEQGNIEYFTQMKSHERRVVVEETSGITRFEEKKKDAFFRMEEVKANLERVEDIYREVTKSLEKAEEESGRLRIFNTLKERLREIDIALLIDGHIKFEKREAKLREREEALLNEMGAKETQKHTIREALRSKEEEITLIDNVGRQIELDIKGKEKDMESRMLELNYLEEEKKRLETAAKELRRELEELSGKIARNRGEIERLTGSAEREKSDLNIIERQVADLEVEREELKRIRESMEREAEDGRNRLFGVMTRLTEIRNKMVARERALKERQARQQRRMEEQNRFRDKLRLLEEKSSILQQRAENEKVEKDRLEADERELAARYEGLLKDAADLRNEMEGLKGVKKAKEEMFRQLKSYGEGRKKDAVPYRQLIDILKPSKETEHFMEKFFSRETEYYVLTENDPYSLAIIAKEYPGNFVFFPKKGMFGYERGEADIKLLRAGSLSEAFRRIENGEEGLFVAGNVLVDSRGFIRKGQDRSTVSISQFREKMKLETELAEIEEKLKVKMAKLSELQASQKELEKARQAQREKRRSKEAAWIATEREIVQIAAEIRTVKERLNELVSGSEPVIEDDASSSSEDEAREKEACEKEKIRIEQALRESKERLEEAKENYSGIDSEFHQKSIAVERSRNQVRKNEEEMVRRKGAMEAFEKESESKKQKLAEVERDLLVTRQKTEELEKSYASLEVECNKAISRYEEMKGKLGEMHMEKASLQQGLQTVDQEIEKIRARKEGVEKEALLLQEKKDTVRNKLRDDYGIEKVEDEPLPAAKDEGEREKILEELAAIGEVNFRAEKEHGELKERLEFLEKQKADLVQAMESLKKTIAKIDSVSRELFLETFERVNEAFKRLTRTLFKGGHGMLMLNQDTNGIDLYVQPPGKKVIRMELLSGGEKALISLSFLLSLMETKASPFTLMDEIDAPLDDANLLSLMEIIKIISKKTQILLITHNRMTMESSNTIYGITMEEDGISKSISIKL